MSRKRPRIFTSKGDVLKHKARERIRSGEHEKSLELRKIFEAGSPSELNHQITTEAFNGLDKVDFALRAPYLESKIYPKHKVFSAEKSSCSILKFNEVYQCMDLATSKKRSLYIKETKDSQRLAMLWPQTLPEEVVEIVRSYLDLRTIMRCCCVCRAWKEAIVNNTRLWSTLDFSPYCMKLRTKTYVELIGKHYKSIRHLNVSGCRLISAKGYKFMAQLPLELVSLRMSSVNNVFGSEFYKIVKRSSQTLTFLDVSCSYISTESLEEALISCQNMQHLILSHCSDVNIGRCFSNVLSKSKPLGALSTLYMESCKVLSSDLETTYKCCPSIKILVLDSANILGEFSLSSLSSLKLLEHLSLRNFCSRIQPIPLDNLSDTYFFPNLKELIITSSEIDSHTLKNILCRLAKLEKLDLSKCNSIEDDALLCIQHYSKLRSITLENCSRLSNTGISSLITNSYNLEYLNISGTSVSDSIIDTIAQNCPSLKTLSMNRVRSINNSSILKMAEKFRTTLEVLNISNCTNINTKAVHYLRAALQSTLINASIW